MSDPIQTVAMRICDLRDIAGLSQEQVAERAGVPLEEYIAYEAGTRDFSFSHLFNIAGVLGVDISDLLTGESPKLKGYILTRAGKGLAFERRKAYQYEHLAYNFRDKKAEPFMVTVDYDPSGKEKPAHSHEGQDFDYVLEGHMKIVLGGNDVPTPRPGRFDLLRFRHSPCHVRGGFRLPLHRSGYQVGGRTYMAFYEQFLDQTKFGSYEDYLKNFHVNVPENFQLRVRRVGQNRRGGAGSRRARVGACGRPRKDADLWRYRQKIQSSGPSAAKNGHPKGRRRDAGAQTALFLLVYHHGAAQTGRDLHRRPATHLLTKNGHRRTARTRRTSK